jgi:hypothetical protein
VYGFNRTDERQPKPFAFQRFAYHVRTPEEETEDGESGPRITLARYSGGSLVDTGIPFEFVDEFGIFEAPTTPGETVFGLALYWPDANRWEPFARCG